MIRNHVTLPRVKDVDAEKAQLTSEKMLLETEKAGLQKMRQEIHVALKALNLSLNLTRMGQDHSEALEKEREELRNIAAVEKQSLDQEKATWLERYTSELETAKVDFGKEKERWISAFKAESDAAKHDVERTKKELSEYILKKEKEEGIFLEALKEEERSIKVRSVPF